MAKTRDGEFQNGSLENTEDSHFPNTGGDKVTNAAIRQHHQLAMGQKLDGVKDPYKGLDTSCMVGNGNGKTY